MRGNNLVIGIFYHPEAYPPTLNAVSELSDCFDHISIVHQPHLKGTWKYPANVTAIASGDFISSIGHQNASLPRKILIFLQFTFSLLKQCRLEKPGVILLYDVHALFAYSLIRPLLRFKHTLWYHNHDISEIARERKFSIGWFACRSEKKIFKAIDIFTLPSSERLAYFPMNEFKGTYFIVPNYPSLKFYGPYYKPGRPVDNIKLIFQGRIGEGHGLEEIISLLASPLSGKSLSLVLKGYCDEAYRNSLIERSKAENVTDKLTFVGFTPYEDVPKVASDCHIGIGIFTKKEAMHVTLGTASNKLYEYAALGLPVIYNKEEHFSRYLDRYNWAFGVDPEPGSIRERLAAIIDNYEYYSVCAHRTFVDALNFETCFEPVRKIINDKR
jgi:hypothetical protein